MHFISWKNEKLLFFSNYGIVHKICYKSRWNESIYRKFDNRCHRVPFTRKTQHIDTWPLVKRTWCIFLTPFFTLYMCRLEIDLKGWTNPCSKEAKSLGHTTSFLPTGTSFFETRYFSHVFYFHVCYKKAFKRT